MSTLKRGRPIGSFPYKIVKPLGQQQGNMSEVYLATTGSVEQLNPADFVVLKIARIQDANGQFYHATLDNEVERLRRLEHSGIVRILPIQRAGMPNATYMAQSGLPGRPWFSVLEYLGGGSLASLIEKHKQLDIYYALQITHALAATLDHLHKGGQVHLDLKPENILFRNTKKLNQRLEPVLIDFGITRDIGQTGLEAGTLQYAPPERIQGTSRATQAPELLARPHPSMDIYALGMVLYQMVTGKLPYQGRSRKGLTSEILSGQPTVPSQYRPDISPTLNGIILKLIDRRPENRPSAEQLMSQLSQVARGFKEPDQDTIITYAITTDPTTPTKSRSRWVGRAIAIFLSLLVVAGIFLFTTMSGNNISSLIQAALNDGSNTTAVADEKLTTTLTPTETAVEKSTTIAETQQPSPTTVPQETATSILLAPTSTPLSTSTPVPDIPTATIEPTSTPYAILIPTATQPVVVQPQPQPTAAAVAAACPDPRAVVSSPTVNQTVAGDVDIMGTATHEQFSRYKIEFAQGADASSNFNLWAEYGESVTDSILSRFDTTSLSNGSWTFRLTVVNITGNYPDPCQVTVNVQNKSGGE